MFDNATPEQLSDLQSRFERWGGGIMPDHLLRENFVNYLTARNAGRNRFDLKLIRRDWFTQLSNEEQNAILQLIGASGLAPAGGS